MLDIHNTNPRSFMPAGGEYCRLSYADGSHLYVISPESAEWVTPRYTALIDHRHWRSDLIRDGKTLFTYKYKTNPIDIWNALLYYSSRRRHIVAYRRAIFRLMKLYTMFCYTLCLSDTCDHEPRDIFGYTVDCCYINGILDNYITIADAFTDKQFGNVDYNNWAWAPIRYIIPRDFENLRREIKGADTNGFITITMVHAAENFINTRIRKCIMTAVIHPDTCPTYYIRRPGPNVKKGKMYLSTYTSLKGMFQ